MEIEHLRNLLRRTESDTLDFKRDQYAFTGATDDEKSELLKDILAFANAWKDSDAHIIIGVPEKDGRALKAIGATSLQDSDVQQFVASKVNRPLLFHVESVNLDGVDVTVIRVDRRQARPLFLKKRYGRLEAGVVYIRRGSSTDKADPEEIAEIGRDDIRSTNHEKLSEVSLELEHVLDTWEQQGGFGGMGSLDGKRKTYDVDILRLLIRNTGLSIAKYVKGEIYLPKQLLWNYAPRPLKLPETLDENQLGTFPFNNNLTPPRPTIYAKPLPPDWHPILPQERLQVYYLRVFPLALMQQFNCEVRWKVQADSSPAGLGMIMYKNIPIVDERSGNS